MGELGGEWGAEVGCVGEERGGLGGEYGEGERVAARGGRGGGDV